MPEDVMTQFMQMMRMMEFVRDLKQRREEEANPLGRFASNPRIRQELESIPEGPLREEAKQSLMRYSHVPEGQRGKVGEYLDQPSEQYQMNRDKFMMDVEDFKGQLADMHEEPKIMRSMLERIGNYSKEDIDAVMTPIEERNTRRMQRLLGVVSRLGVHTSRAHPRDPVVQGYMKDLEATAALGQGGGDAFGGQPGGERRPPSNMPAPQQPGQIGPMAGGYQFPPGQEDPRLEALTSP